MMSILQKSRGAIHRRPLITLIVSLLVLASGAYLIWNNFAAKTPDAVIADLSTATKFVGSDRYLSLTSAQRNDYLNALGARYLQESPANRQIIENALKANGVEHSAKRSLALGMLRQLLAQYRTLTPDQKRQRIGMLRTFATAMGFKGPSVSALDPKINPVANATGSEEGFQAGMNSFNRDFLNELSAEERSTLSMLAKDIREMK